MHIYNSVSIQSLGSSCISEDSAKEILSIQGVYADYKSGIFDWVIISPGSIIEFFEYLKDDNIAEILTNEDNYLKLEEPYKVYRNMKFESFYIWHVHELDEIFSSKTLHKLGNMYNDANKKYFILNNTSTQLKENMADVGDDYEKYIISWDQYLKIKNHVKELFDGELILISKKSLTMGFPEDFIFYKKDSVPNLFN